MYPLGVKLETGSAAETVDLATWADDSGFSTVWIGEGGLTASAIPALALAAHSTNTVRIASGIVPFRTRNAALLALEFSTLDGIAPGRITMGLGAWWEPIASSVGLGTSRPMAAMREVVTVIRALLAGETVTHEGEFVSLSEVRIESLRSAARIPVVIGAVRPGMVALSGEIADGVLLNFLVPPSYTEDALRRVRDGADRAGRDLARFEAPQLIVTSIDDSDPDSAVDDCRAFLTRNIARQAHIAEYSGADPELVDAIRATLGPSPTAASLAQAMKLVPASLVRSVCACGTTTEALDSIGAYLAAGATEAAIAPVGAGIRRTLRRLAPYARTRR